MTGNKTIMKKTIFIAALAATISFNTSAKQLSTQGKSALADAQFWTEGYGLKAQECLIIQDIYSDKGCLIIHQSPTQQFELRIPKLTDCPAYLPAQVKHILILDKLTDAKRKELQESLKQQNKAHIRIYAAANYLPSNSKWPTP